MSTIPLCHGRCVQSISFPSVHRPTGAVLRAVQCTRPRIRQPSASVRTACKRQGHRSVPCPARIPPRRNYERQDGHCGLTVPKLESADAGHWGFRLGFRRRILQTCCPASVCRTNTHPRPQRGLCSVHERCYRAAIPTHAKNRNAANQVPAQVCARSALIPACRSCGFPYGRWKRQPAVSFPAPYSETALPCSLRKHR